MTDELAFLTEKDKYISGVVFSEKNDAIIGYYTSPLGNVSQYNFSPVTIIKQNISGDMISSKGELDVNSKSIKFPNGYFLLQIYKSITQTSPTNLIISMEFITKNMQNDIKNFINTEIFDGRKIIRVDPLNYKSNCSSYITGINEKFIKSDVIKNTIEVVCPHLPDTTVPTITYKKPVPNIFVKDTENSNKEKIFILICIIVLGVFLYKRNTHEFNVAQKEPNRNLNEILKPSSNY